MNNDTTPITQDLQEHSSPSIHESIAALLEQFKTGKKTMEYIRPEMLPDIDLYMDQVTTFMDSHLQSTKRYPGDKILTKTMINNYAKNDLLPPPHKKKYSKDHLLLLTFIYYLKNMLSMNDIQSLLEPVKARFFQNQQAPIRLEDIYREIFSQARDTQDSILSDIYEKYEKSRESFNTDSADEPAVPDKEDTAMLQDFTFVCLLCYDIFLKKQLVEQIIDTMNEAQHPLTGAKGPEKHK